MYTKSELPLMRQPWWSSKNISLNCVLHVLFFSTVIEIFLLLKVCFDVNEDMVCTWEHEMSSAYEKYFKINLLIQS